MSGFDADAPVAPSSNRRRHSTGEATRELLMVTAERLFALRGVEGVTLREIQEAAGQSNASVITYHFGSKAGLVRSLIANRYQSIDDRRRELFQEAEGNGWMSDPRAVVWVLVLPLVESIGAGEMIVPLLAQLSENPRANREFWPPDLKSSGSDLQKELVYGVLDWMPERVRRGREVQLYNSVLNLLGEHARSQHRISPARLSNYVDGWVGMLVAPVSPETQALMTTAND